MEWFDRQVYANVPHIENGRVVSPTPLVDITDFVKNAALDVYGVKLNNPFEVFGKQESSLPGGSIKTRPATNIIRDAILAGRIRRGTAVFEATSGNFGLALSLLNGLGVNAVCIISRKLEQGVKDALARCGAKTIYINAEICPVPFAGYAEQSQNYSMINDVLDQLNRLGFDAGKANRSEEVRKAIINQDAIGLAQALAQAYGGFCTEQYTNESNVRAYQGVMGKEIEQQLAALGKIAKDFEIVCAFGTGGTSTGLSTYFSDRYGTKNVLVAFPKPAQDVAGIRTKENARGLRFYMPQIYAGEVEVDFDEAKQLIGYAAKKQLSIGESSAIVLYAAIREIASGRRKMLVMLADGNEKY
ncbi:MAG: pyridoxal-phosphate dependent enzyme, partial [Candidatus Micrarchaeia archaeon]